MSIDVDFLVEDLIESVKDEGFIPSSQTTFEDEDILRLLNGELVRVMMKIIKKREDFFYQRETTQLISGKDHYLVPKSAAGTALKALFLVDSANNKIPLVRRDVDRLNESGSGSLGFYFEADEVVLMDTSLNSGSSLLFVYSSRPNRLVMTENCAKITNVASVGGTTTFTVDTDLTASLSTSDEVDFLRAVSPFSLWAKEVAITSITSTTIAVATSGVSDVDGSVEPGVDDYICPTGYANIAMLPIEFHSVLAQRTAYKQLLAMGHNDKAVMLKRELDENEADALAIIQNRAESSPIRPSRKRGLLKTFRSW